MNKDDSVTQEGPEGPPAERTAQCNTPVASSAAAPSAGAPGAVPGRSAGSLPGPSTQPTPQDVRSWYIPTFARNQVASPAVPAAMRELPFAPDTELFTRITPGFILESIPREQAVTLSTSRLFPQSPDQAPQEFTLDMSRSLARRMLAALPAEDLRAVCRRLRLPADGEFVDLYRRLSLLC